jgi:DNA-directed RNA polymerase subunit M/transcription elongation factor TFIIS
MALPKIESPKYELKIPSTAENVTYRPYLVKEEKILMMAMESDNTTQMMNAIKDVIRSCTENSVEVDNLAMFDLEYIFTQLRSKSVGETSTISVSCKECETKNDVDIDLQNVYVNIPETDTSTVALTDSISVKLRYPSVNQTLKYQSGGNNKSEVDRVFDLVVACIDSIYTADEIFDASEQPESELREFIESLNTKQFNEISGFIETIPTASIDVSFKCASCGVDNQFDVKGLGNFFG